MASICGVVFPMFISIGIKDFPHFQLQMSSGGGGGDAGIVVLGSNC